MTQVNLNINGKSKKGEIIAAMEYMEGHVSRTIEDYADLVELKYKGMRNGKEELQTIYKKMAQWYNLSVTTVAEAKKIGLELDPTKLTVKQMRDEIRQVQLADAEEQIKKVEKDAKQKGIVVEQEEVKPVVVDVDAEEELEPISTESLEELVNEPAQQEKVETTMTEANVTTEAKETDPKKLTLEQKRLRNIQHVLNTQKPEDVLKTLSLAGFTPTFDVHANAVMLVDNYKAIKESQRKQAESERKQAEPTITIEQAKAMVAQVQAETQERAQTHFDSVQDAQEAKMEDVGALYDALKDKAGELRKMASEFAKAGNKQAYQASMDKYEEVMAKVKELVSEHKDTIFSGERAARITNEVRQTVANGLRTTAETTNKYGHVGIDTLMNVANQVLNGAVEVSKKVLEGGEAIAKTGINVAGTVGHATVDGVSGALNAAADIIEPKQK